MNIKFTLFLLLMACALIPMGAYAEGSTTTTPFTSTSSTLYRIPSLVRIDANTLVAFSDNRGSNGADVGKRTGHISIVAKLSKDNGTTWGNEITILDASKNTDANFSYSDAATVYDPDAKKILLMCCGGSVSYQNSSASNRLQTFMAIVDPSNLQTVEPTNITTIIYGLFPSATGLFPTSGEMCRSAFIKEGTNNRIYLALATSLGTKVIYTDNLGTDWAALGTETSDIMYNANKGKSDETKCMELPDGNVWISSRYTVDGFSRGFNVFSYSDDAYTASTGSWGTVSSEYCEATPTGGNFKMSKSRTNGGLVIIPARRVSDGTNVYIALHSIPYGHTVNGTANQGRHSLGINWKILKDRNDFTTMDGNDPSASKKLLTGWNNYQVTSDYAAYSTLHDNTTDGVDLYYEDGAGNDSPYNMVYKSIPLSTITGGAYTYASDMSREAYMNVNVKPEPGNVYLIKARYTASDGTITEGYLHSNFSISTTGGVSKNDDASLTASQPKGTDQPDPTYYWAFSQDATTESPYFSSFNADGYMGWGGSGTDYYNGGTAKTVICTPLYSNTFPIVSFEHNGTVVSGGDKSLTGYNVDGYSMQFVHSGYGKAPDYANRFLAVKSDGSSVNWNTYTSKSFTTKGSWTTDLIFVKVVPNDTKDYGTFNEPTFSNSGFPITFARSEDNCVAYQNAVKNGTDANFDFNCYATIRAPFAVYVPDDVKVYKLKDISNGKRGDAVTLTEYTDLPTVNSKRIIPRETPVIMQVAGAKGDGNTSVTKYFELAPGQTFDKTTDADGNNTTTKLSGTLGREVLSTDTYKDDVTGTGTYVYYLLGKVDGYVALYRLGKNTTGDFAIAKNKAYFKFNTTTSSTLI